MISLEKIDQVTERTGCSYKEAKEELEKANGDVIEAIIAIEKSYEDFDDYDDFEVYEEDGSCKTNSKSHCSGKRSKKDTSKIVEAIKGLIKVSNATRIVFYKDDNIILDIPVSAGALSAFFFIHATAVGVVAAFLSGCSIKLFRKNGETVTIKEFSKEAVDKLKKQMKDAENKDAGTYEDVKAEKDKDHEADAQ